MFLEADHLTKTFRPRARLFGRQSAEIPAVRDVSFSLESGHSLGVVGESGSGKTTLARMLVGLEVPTSGRIAVQGRWMTTVQTRVERERLSRLIQIVFQDPYTSLDPHQSIRRALDELQRIHFSRSSQERRARSDELLASVGLGDKEATVLPRELSGGQRQRAAICRALVAEPLILILDEAVSALDVSIQAQILNLLAELRMLLKLTYVVISHDLAVVRQIADDVIVMYRGRIVESGQVEEILREPRHPYTRRLVGSIPRPDMAMARQPAVLHESEGGCLFRDRCEYAYDQCFVEPELRIAAPRHSARCWLVPGATKEQIGG